LKRFIDKLVEYQTRFRLVEHIGLGIMAVLIAKVVMFLSRPFISIFPLAIFFVLLGAAELVKRFDLSDKYEKVFSKIYAWIVLSAMVLASTLFALPSTFMVVTFILLVWVEVIQFNIAVSLKILNKHFWIDTFVDLFITGMIGVLIGLFFLSKI
jgi:hypothetical protein